MAKRKIPNFGYSGRPETMNIDTLPHAGDIGVVYEENTKRWQIAQCVDANSAVAGDALYWKSYPAYTVTPTIGNSSKNEIAGFGELVITANNYCAVRQGGIMSVHAKGAVTFARGNMVCGDTANNCVDLVAAATQKCVGIAQADQTAGKVSVFLTIEPT